MIEDLQRALSNLEDTRGAITKYRDEILHFRSWDPENDIRIKILSQLDQCLMTHNITLRITKSELKDLRWIKATLSVTDNHTAAIILSNYVVNNKNGLIYSVSSVIERYFRLIYIILKPLSKVSEDYRQIRLKLFEILGTSVETDEWKALAILANIRNTIHNNGIYTDNNNPEIRIIYKGQCEAFINGVPHSSATYTTLNLIIADILSLIRQFNSKTRISSIPIIKESFDRCIDRSSKEND